MKSVTNFAFYNGCFDDYGVKDLEEVMADCRKLGLDGIEAIWDLGEYSEKMPDPGQSVGYHLTFWGSWVDFWLGRKDLVFEQNGSWDRVKELYGGLDREGMIEIYGRDIGLAMEVDAEYLVFHVSEVNGDECFTYCFSHDDDEVIDCAVECINRVTPFITNGAALLVENQWWPGFRFDDPGITHKLLDGIEYDNKGIMLDIGHLMNTNTALRTQQDGIDYINRMLDEHGELSRMVRGLHLHQSLSGEYVEANGYKFTQEYLDAKTPREKFSKCYDHILKIDRHQPWSNPDIADVVKRIDPEWVNHELSAFPWDERMEALEIQVGALREGGLA